MTLSKIDTWIKAGYKLLGTEGMDGIKVERIAKILELNKSGFYHYFGTMERFVKRLLQFHAELATTVASKVAKCESIDPDLLLLIVEHRAFFLVDAQLLVKGRPAQGEDVKKAGRIVNDELLLLWERTGNVPEDSSAALGFLDIIRHFFYARMDAENVSYEFLQGLSAETQDVLSKIMMDKHVSSHHPEGPVSTSKRNLS